MPKNKGKFKSRMPALPEEELASLTSRAVEAIRPHALKLGAVLGGVAVVLIAFSVWSWWDARKEGEATRLFGEAMDILEARIVPPDDQPMQTEEAGPSYPSVKDRAEAALAVLERLERDYGGTRVNQHADLVRGSLLYDAGRHDEAIQRYERFLSHSAMSRLAVLAREGIGYAREARALAAEDSAAREAGLKEALSAFEKVQPDENGFYRDYALYHQARIQAILGNREQAVELYKQVLERFPATGLRQEVTTRLSELEGQES